MPAAHLLKELSDVSSRLWAARDLEEGLREMLAATVRLLGADMGNVQLFDDERGVLTIVAHEGFEPDFLAAIQEVSIDADTVCGRAIRLRRRIITEDVEFDPNFAPYLEAARRAGFRTVQCTPLTTPMGDRLGAMSTYFSAPRAFDEEELVCLDVYARQAADFIERWSSDERLRRSEARLRALVKASCYSIYRMNRDWSGMRELNGGEVLADTSAPAEDWLQHYICPEDRSVVLEAVRDAIGSRRMFDLEHRVRRADGSIGWTRSRAVPIEDATGEIAEWFGTATDITAQKNSEIIVQEEARRKDEFLAILAHELRNPLAALHSAFTAASRGAAAADAARLNGVIERQMGHLIRLVDDLLDISRITTGNFRLDRMRFDLAAAIRQAIETSGPAIESGQRRLSVSVCEETLVVEGDRVRLAQAIANLLDNAAKYTLDGGRIDIELKRDGAEAVVEVRDDGIGIPPEKLPHIFELFARSDRAVVREINGLGVGLALVRKLVGLHGGCVEGHSDGADCGSRFRIRLPLAAAPAEAERSSFGASRPRARKVLIVDDDRDVADSLCMLLETMGVDAQAAYSGAEALRLLADVAPDVIFVDIGMPSMDGYATAVALRERPEGRRAKLVALSGWGEEKDRRRSKEAGFEVHVVKPIDIAELERLSTETAAPRMERPPDLP
jgi:signal transduction histidine kinase/CheY-like chemotaxis protein